MKIFKNYATKHYLKAQEVFIENELRVPSLFLYSKDDIVAQYKIIEEVINGMKQRGNHVAVKRFDGSPHIQHFQFYPEEYTAAMNTFLADIGLVHVHEEQRKETAM